MPPSLMVATRTNLPHLFLTLTSNSPSSAMYAESPPSPSSKTCSSVLNVRDLTCANAPIASLARSRERASSTART
eukprot:CAMPEP_0119507574 /NCGR_PEP_ID=MMETSP1344-20130328/27429_1 /TAXON_ID=236787 /ORGANISM="Florenciella parvula, Strain CCMP2471" /LENGTH=74 /DNA_ID=CAMNT_0007544219 /DNA_START=256 /DNA_END=477 /DNA_ORIENTATION=-